MQNNEAKILQNLEEVLKLQKEAVSTALNSMQSRLGGTPEFIELEKDVETLMNLDAIKGRVDISDSVSKIIEKYSNYVNANK